MDRPKKFIGQENIIREVDILISKLIKGKKATIMFKANSGYGKTDLALRFMKIIKQTTGDKFAYFVGEFRPITNILNYIVDEIHEIKRPEFIYPYIDSKKYNFIFCTNEYARLKEPLLNRCHIFYFSEYELSHIMEIVRNKLETGIETDFIRIIAQNANGNPRIAVQLSERLDTIFQSQGIPKNSSELLHVMENILNIKDGLNEIQQRYLNFIKKTRKASLEVIANSINVDKMTIQREIEPILIKKGLITITGRGRIIN